jgi:MinD superfamily P-loop ATPase
MPTTLRVSESLPLAATHTGDHLISELVVISGKGGTGKTSVTASFAVLARTAVVADCDVDAADLHFLLEPEIREHHIFRSGHEASIREADCDGCGDCLEVCRFGALSPQNGSAAPNVDPVSCEGCGVCVYVCPRRAIDFLDRTCGEWFVSGSRSGPMVHARLGIAAENSGRLVSTVRAAARRVAAEARCRLILVDGPPGIGCPVISSITGATAVLVVTEPSVSGAHDLDRVLSLTRHFGIPAAVCVNRWDLDADTTRRIEAKARSSGAATVGRIRYDPVFTEAQILGKTVVELGGPAANDIRKVWDRIARSNWWQTGTAPAVPPPSTIEIRGGHP